MDSTPIITRDTVHKTKVPEHSPHQHQSKREVIDQYLQAGVVLVEKLLYPPDGEHQHDQ